MSQEAPEQQRLVAGRYRLRRPIGQGSMGTVWAAYDEDLRRPVAVKEVLLAPGIPAEEADELRERTLREARAIAMLSHPNVVTLHDIARENGEPFVVMELVAGRSLAHLLVEHGPLGTEQGAVVADAVAAALQAAHAAGITHRDVKPGNVLIAEDGRVKLTDFGIARSVSEQTLTRTGIMLGSPSYIAPEVASGEDVTPSADLWGLGATLFAAMEGRAPYDPDGDVMETLTQVVNGEVPQPSTAGPLTEVITGLMVKDPARRLTLAEVRRRIYPLLPEPGRSVFTGEAIEEARAATADWPTKVVTPSPPKNAAATDTPGPAATGNQPLAAAPGPLPFAQPLAEAPGPLPFEPTKSQPVPARSSRVASPVVMALAFVVFVVAVVGGFALTRVLGGQQLLPPKPVTSQPAQPTVPMDTDLVPQTGEALTNKGIPGGRFTVDVPREWSRFVEERVTKELGSSTLVHFVPADGKYDLTVERYPEFYPGHDIADYQSALGSLWSKDDFRAPQPPEEITVAGAGGPEPARDFMYRTVDRVRGNEKETRRTTYVRALPMGHDLWVVSLTAPTVEEDRAKDLFDRIAPTFKITG